MEAAAHLAGVLPDNIAYCTFSTLIIIVTTKSVVQLLKSKVRHANFPV